MAVTETAPVSPSGPSETSETPEPAPEPGEALAERIFSAGLGALELVTIQLGERLGFYAALRDQGPATVAEVAAATGTAERYVQEWLEQQATAELIEVDDPSLPADQRRFSVHPDVAAVLLDEESPLYTMAFAEFPTLCGTALPAVTEAFRSGEGVPYEHYELHHAQARQNRTVFANDLVSSWLAAADGLVERLTRPGARAADFGAGEAWSSVYLAEAFPELTVHAFDVDDASVEAGRRIVGDRGLGDRVTVHLQDIGDEAFGEGPYDLVLGVEMVHDLADPVGALRSMRRLIADDGAVIVVDEKVADEFGAFGDELERVFYGFSVMHCLPVGLVGDEPAGTGTVMRPSTLREYAVRAGFSDLEVLPVEHDFFNVYRLVP